LKAADALAKHVGVKPACAALEVSRSTLYRRRSPSTGQQQPRPTPARALSEKERDRVFDTLCPERFVDRSPTEVVATLLDEEVYLCSERTMYRVLASEMPVQERRAQRTHPEYKKPELMATAPNQVWSWDITRLLGPKKWSYYYLYVIMYIYSCYVVGWIVVDRENSALAGRPIDPAELPEAWRPAPDPDPALGSRSSDDEPMHRSTPRGPRRDPLVEPTSGVG
jgi:putative transposase